MSDMRVSVEIMRGLERRLTVVVPSQEMEKSIKSRIQQLTKTMKVDGFRPGKVPTRVIEQQYGEAIRAEAIDKLLQSSLGEALKREDLQPAATPVVQSIKAEPGADLEYTIVFETLPEVKLPDLKTISLEKMVVSITDEDVERVLTQMTKQYAEWKEVQRPVAMGDKLTVDAQTIVDGNVEQDQVDTFIVLDEHSAKAGFSALEKRKVGDDITIDLPKHPEVAAEHADKKIQVKVKIKAISEPILPAIDEELVRKLGVKSGTVEGLRKEVRENMAQGLENNQKGKLKESLLDELLKRHTIDLPKTMVAQEYQHLLQSRLAELEKRDGQKKTEEELPQIERDKLQKVAQERVVFRLLFGVAMKEYKVTVEDTDVRAHVEKMLGMFEDSAAMLEMLNKNKEWMNNLRGQVLETKLIEELLKHVQYQEKKMSYSDAMKLGEQHHEHVHDEFCDHEHDA